MDMDTTPTCFNLYLLQGQVSVSTQIYTTANAIQLACGIADVRIGHFDQPTSHLIPYFHSGTISCLPSLITGDRMKADIADVLFVST